MSQWCRIHFQLKYVIHFIPFLILVLCSVSSVAFVHSDLFRSKCQCVPFAHQMNHNVSHRLISFDANTNRNILSFIATKCFEWDKRTNKWTNERKLIEKCAHIKYISLILAWIHTPSTIQPKYSLKKNTLKSNEILKYKYFVSLCFFFVADDVFRGIHFNITGSWMWINFSFLPISWHFVTVVKLFKPRKND